MRKNPFDWLLPALPLLLLIAFASWATVPSSTQRVEYAGNGATTSFAVSFPYLAKSEVVVTEISSGGQATVKTLTTHYTLTAPNGVSGTVTMLTAPATGTTLRIERSVPYTQTTNFRAQGDFTPGIHENAFDRLTYQTQQLHRRVTALEDGGVTFSTGTVTTNYLVLNDGGTLTFGDGTTMTTAAATYLTRPTYSVQACCRAASDACNVKNPTTASAPFWIWSFANTTTVSGVCYGTDTTATDLGVQPDTAAFHINDTLTSAWEYRARVQVDSPLGSGIRGFAGLATADPTTSATPGVGGVSYVGFRWATGDTAFQCCKGDGTADACTSSGVTFATGHILEWTGSAWRIDGTTVCAGGVGSVTPSASARMQTWTWQDNSSGANRLFRAGWVTVRAP